MFRIIVVYVFFRSRLSMISYMGSRLFGLVASKQGNFNNNNKILSFPPSEGPKNVRDFYTDLSCIGYIISLILKSYPKGNYIRNFKKIKKRKEVIWRYGIVLYILPCLSFVNIPDSFMNFLYLGCEH